MLRSIVKYISNEFVTLLGWGYPDYRTDIYGCIVNSFYMRDLHQFRCLIDHIELDKHEDQGKKRIMRCDNGMPGAVFDESTCMCMPVMAQDYETLCGETTTRCYDMSYTLQITTRIKLLQLAMELNYLEPVIYLLPDDIHLISDWMSEINSIRKVMSNMEAQIPILRVIVEKYGEITLDGVTINTDVLDSWDRTSDSQALDKMFGIRNCRADTNNPLTPELAKMAYEYIMKNYDKRTQLSLTQMALEVINAGIDIDINILRAIVSVLRTPYRTALSSYVEVLDGTVDDYVSAIETCMYANNKVCTTVINHLKDKLTFDQVVRIISYNNIKDVHCVQLITDTLTSYQQLSLIQRLSDLYHWNPMELLKLMLTLTKVDKQILESRINNYLGGMAASIEVKLK